MRSLPAFGFLSKYRRCFFSRCSAHVPEEFVKQKEEKDSNLAKHARGYALCGGTGTYETAGSVFLLVKTDSSGNLEWNQTFSGSSLAIATSMLQPSDSGYLLVGRNSYYMNGMDTTGLLIKTTSEVTTSSMQTPNPTATPIQTTKATPTFAPTQTQLSSPTPTIPEYPFTAVLLIFSVLTVFIAVALTVRKQKVNKTNN